MELLIKVNSADGDKSYKDGDIVQAFSNDRILLANAQSICSVDINDDETYENTGREFVHGHTTTISLFNEILVVRTKDLEKVGIGL